MIIPRKFVIGFLIAFVLVALTSIFSFVFDFYKVYFVYALLLFSGILLFLVFRKRKAGFWFEFPKYVFLLLLLLVTVSSLKFEFMSSFTSFFKPYQMFLTIATIAIGALVFWMNRDVVEEIEKEKEDEEQEERKRYEEFDGRFPRLSRIWGLRSVVKWCYKEGWWYVGGLICIVLLGAFFRFYFINYHAPFIDEYNHLNAAKRLLEEGVFNYKWDYIVTYLVYFSFKLFNINVFSAKLPFVLMSLISIILIYIFSKNINKKVGLISAYLFAISPFAIGMANYIRRYEVGIFLSLIFLVYIETILKKINNRIKSFLYLILPAFVLIILFLFFPNFVLDRSMLEVVLPSVFLFLFFRFLFFEKSFNNKKALLFWILGFILLLTIFKFLGYFDYHLEIDRSLNMRQNFIFLKNLFFDPLYPLSHQWFNINLLYYPSIPFLIFLSSLVLIKDRSFFSNFFSFIAIFLTFILFFNPGPQPSDRHAYSFFIFYSVIFSAGIYVSFFIFKRLSKESRLFKFAFILILLVILTLFNPINSFVIINQEPKSGYSFLNGAYYSDIYPVLDFLEQRQINNSITLITTHPKEFIFFLNYSFIKQNDSSSFYDVFPYVGQINNYDLSYNVYTGAGYADYSKLRNITQIHEEGYIVLEKFYYTRSDVGILPVLKNNTDFQIDNISVTFLGQIGSFYIYKW